MDELRKIQKEKYKKHNLEKNILPKIGECICLDPIKLSAYRITKYLKKNWFKEKSNIEGIYTIRINDKIYDIRIIGLLLENYEEIKKITTNEYHINRIKTQFKKISNLKYIQNIEFDKSLSKDNAQNINNNIYIELIIKKFKKYEDKELTFQIYKEYMQQFLARINSNITIDFNSIYQYIYNNNLEFILKSNEEEFIIKSLSLFSKLSVLKIWLKYSNKNYNNMYIPNWFIAKDSINEYCKKLETLINNNLDEIYSKKNKISNNNLNNLCCNCFNTYSNENLINFDENDLDFIICFNCYEKLNN